MSDWGATRRISAEVVLADGVVLEGDMHLVASAAYPLSSESPLDMLNRPEPFFALTLGAGRGCVRVEGAGGPGVLPG